jgi:hypothetical protein
MKKAVFVLWKVSPRDESSKILRDESSNILPEVDPGDLSPPTVRG